MRVPNRGIFVEFSMYWVTIFLDFASPFGLEAKEVKILENVSRMETRRDGSRDNSG